MSGKGSQLGERFGKRTDLGFGRGESQMLSEAANYGLQNFAIGMELALLGVRFEFRVETQEFRVGDGLAVGSENGAQRGKYSRLPVNEGAVTVEAERGGIERSSTCGLHATKANPGLVPWAAFLATTNDYFTSIDCSSLKLRADSAGRTMSLLPVKAAPPAPAPPPASAPIPAPLPPPARPPINAPSAAPPPARTAVRLPLPVAVRDHRRGGNGLLRTADSDRSQSQLQRCSALETAKRLGVNYGSGCRRARRDRRFAIDRQPGWPGWR